MVTPTLFDIAAITWLKPTENTYDPDVKSDDSIAFSTLANQLHSGHDVCLSEMIMSSLYKSLSDSVDQLKNLGEKGNLLLYGPFWLLQLWLNATFEASLPNKSLVDEEAEE